MDLPKLKLTSWQWILISLILGCCAGLVLGPKAAMLRPIGMIFLHAIKLLVVPVVATAIINALTKLDNHTNMQRVIGKAFLVYLTSMLVASSLTAIIATLIAPGNDFTHQVVMPVSNYAQHLKPQPIADTLVSFMPANLVQALADGRIPQLLIISVLIGLAIRKAGESGKVVANFFDALSKVVFQIVKLVMLIAPFGIFSLIADATGTNGMVILLPLLKFVATVYISCLAYIILYYGLVITIFGRINLFKFLKAIISACIFAFSTCSSAATIPESIRCTEDNLKVSHKISSLLIPLGTNFNLNGLAIYLTTTAIFAANYYHVHLTIWHYVTIAFTIMVTAAGAGGIPSSALIVMSAVLSSIAVPTNIIGLLVGVDRLNDMAQTTTSVIGDIFSCYLVAKSEQLVADDKESNDDGKDKNHQLINQQPPIKTGPQPKKQPELT